MFKRILVAIDGSDHSRLVIPLAIDVARRFQSKAFVLHVSEHDRGRAPVYSVETPAEATRMVGDGVTAMRAAGIEAQGGVHDVASGHVARNIVQTAAAFEADLVIMGSRGLSDVQGLFLGSVTHDVLHLAPIAVLVARGPLPVEAKLEQPVTAAWAIAPA
jgi:nucleotide-binding universal stress UspA family protein